jgi:hypothetical protein
MVYPLALENQDYLKIWIENKIAYQKYISVAIL